MISAWNWNFFFEYAFNPKICAVQQSKTIKRNDDENETFGEIMVFILKRMITIVQFYYLLTWAGNPGTLTSN